MKDLSFVVIEQFTQKKEPDCPNQKVVEGRMFLLTLKGLGSGKAGETVRKRQGSFEGIVHKCNSPKMDHRIVD